MPRNYNPLYLSIIDRPIIDFLNNYQRPSIASNPQSGASAECLYGGAPVIPCKSGELRQHVHFHNEKTNISR